MGTEETLGGRGTRKRGVRERSRESPERETSWTALTSVAAGSQHAGGAAAAGQEGEGGGHQAVHYAALPRAKLDATGCGEGQTQQVNTALHTVTPAAH